MQPSVPLLTPECDVYYYLRHSPFAEVIQALTALGEINQLNHGIVCKQCQSARTKRWLEKEEALSPHQMNALLQNAVRQLQSEEQKHLTPAPTSCTVEP